MSWPSGAHGRSLADSTGGFPRHRRTVAPRYRVALVVGRQHRRGRVSVSVRAALPAVVGRAHGESAETQALHAMNACSPPGLLSPDPCSFEDASRNPRFAIRHGALPVDALFSKPLRHLRSVQPRQPPDSSPSRALTAPGAQGPPAPWTHWPASWSSMRTRHPFIRSVGLSNPSATAPPDCA